MRPVERERDWRLGDIGVLHDRHRQHRAGGDWVVEARGRLGPLTTLVLLAHRNLDLRGTIAESPELVVHEVLTDVSAATYICAKPIFSLKVRTESCGSSRDCCGWESAESRERDRGGEGWVDGGKRLLVEH